MLIIAKPFPFVKLKYPLEAIKGFLRKTDRLAGQNDIALADTDQGKDDSRTA